jgi:hypothetical protein
MTERCHEQSVAGGRGLFRGARAADSGRVQSSILRANKDPRPHCSGLGLSWLTCTGLPQRKVDVLLSSK